jgi:hypothetical protein
MPDHTLADEVGEDLPHKPGLVNENEYSPLHLRRAERPVEAHNDEDGLDHLDDAEGSQEAVQGVREA